VTILRKTSSGDEAGYRKEKRRRFFIKMYPLAMHKGSYEKAKTIVCEKSFKFLDDAFENKEIPPAKCNTQVMDNNIALAGKPGIQGTPAIIFPDGGVVPGYMPADSLIKEWDAAPLESNQICCRTNGWRE
jgi:thiol:disulfide interchange protein DsbC